MTGTRRWKKWSWGLWTLGALALLLGATDGWAQGRRGLPAEKQAAAQELEAKCVAKMLKLSEEATGQLVTAYKAARDSYRTGSEAIFSSQEGDRASRFEKIRQLGDSEREKLEKSLQAFLTKEQATKASASLGTFSWRWDRYVDTLAGMGLEEGTLYKALDQVNTYVIDSSETSRGASGREGWEARRAELQKHKEKLDKALGAILSEEQLTQWNEATASRRR